MRLWEQQHDTPRESNSNGTVSQQRRKKQPSLLQEQQFYITLPFSASTVCLKYSNVCRASGGGADRCLASWWLREIERMNTSADPRFGTRLMLILWHKYLATRSNPLQSLVFWKLVQEKRGGRNGKCKKKKKIWQSHSDSQIAERTLQKVLSRTIKHANRSAYIPPF